jgi:hypothetical protein
MESFDRIAPYAGDLLARVDAQLARTGAPESHPVWRLLRRMRSRPGEAVAALAGVHPAPLATTGAEVRAVVRAYGSVSATLSAGVAWEGPAAEAFAERRRVLAADAEGAAGRVAALADRADAAADWASAARLRLAVALAQVLGSAEAVAVVTGGADAPGAAADIATRVLSALDEVATAADELAFEAADGPAVRRPQPVPPGRLDATTRAEY